MRPESRISKILHEDGATAAEYAILASLIAAVIVLAVTAVGFATNRNFSSPALSQALGGP